MQNLLFMQGFSEFLTHEQQVDFAIKHGQYIKPTAHFIPQFCSVSKTF